MGESSAAARRNSVFFTTLSSADASCSWRRSRVMSSTFSPLKSVRMPIWDRATFSRISWTILSFSLMTSRTLSLLYSDRNRFFTSVASTGIPGPMVVDT